MRQMILRGPDVHSGVNYIVRGDGRRVKINARSRLINAVSDATTPSATRKQPTATTCTLASPAPNFSWIGHSEADFTQRHGPNRGSQPTS